MPDEALHGYKELSRKLAQLGPKVGGKVLRGSLLSATLKTRREMRAKAPVRRTGGAKRTYKGRLVAPGFLSRSIKTQSRVRNGYAFVRIGVRKEAWYGVTLLDKRPGRTPYRITSRKPSRKRRGRTTSSFLRRSRSAGEIKSYTLPAYPWFLSTFEKHQNRMVRDVGQQMSKRIIKAMKT